jgi:uncharacterized protein
MLQTLSPWRKVWLYVALLLVCAGIGSMLVLAAVGVIWGVPLADIPNFLGSPDTPGEVEAVKWLNSLSLVLAFLCSALLMRWLGGRAAVNGFMLNDMGWLIIIVPFLLISASAPIDLSSQLNNWLIPEGGMLEKWFKPMEDQAERLTDAMLLSQSTGQLITTLLAIGVVPAICEEFAFRGTLQPLLAKATGRMHASVWITAAVFSAIHFQMYGFLPRLLLGALLGYLVIWTGSLWTSILAHLFNNCLAIVMYNVWGGQLETPDDSVASTIPAYIMSIITFAMLIAVLLKYSRWPHYRKAYLGLPAEEEDTVSP